MDGDADGPAGEAEGAPELGVGGHCDVDIAKRCTSSSKKEHHGSVIVDLRSRLGVMADRDDRERRPSAAALSDVADMEDNADDESVGDRPPRGEDGAAGDSDSGDKDDGDEDADDDDDKLSAWKRGSCDLATSAADGECRRCCEEEDSDGDDEEEEDPCEPLCRRPRERRGKVVEASAGDDDADEDEDEDAGEV